MHFFANFKGKFVLVFFWIFRYGWLRPFKLSESI